METKPMEIGAKDVMNLRKATGMPMMQCKKALLEAEGDFEKAVELLRKQGMKTAEKRAGRATGDGLLKTRISEDGKTGTMVYVRCETEPVKNTPKFIEFVEKLADLADENAVSELEALRELPWGDGETVGSTLQNLVGLIGENMQLGGVARFSVDGDGAVAAYIHNDQKQGAIVALSGAGESIPATAREVCQHIVFAKPSVLLREDIPQEAMEKELKFLREEIAEDPKMAGKPEQAIEGIVQGRLNKNFFAQQVLSEQEWYKPGEDKNKNVAQVLEERGAAIQGFRLFAPGA